MKIVAPHSLGLLVAACFSAAVGNMQNAVAQEDFGKVAVLNVARVLKADEQFQLAIKDISAEAKKLKADAEKATELEASLRCRRGCNRKLTELVERETKLYADTYDRMHAAISELSETYGFQLVLRIDGEVQDDSADSLKKKVEQKVVFHKNRDMTSLVIQQMNHGTRQQKVSNKSLKLILINSDKSVHPLDLDKPAQK